MKRLLTFFFVLIFSSILMQGCGGGGGGDGDGASALGLEEAPSLPGDGDGDGSVGEVGDLGDLIDLKDLVFPDGDHWYFTQAVAVNDNGFVIGQSNNGPEGTLDAFIWDPTSESMQSLGKDPTAIWSYAVDINNSNEVIVNSFGESSTYNSTGVWQGGAFTDIPGADKSNDINELGEVVGGIGCGEDLCVEAFYWDGVSDQIQSVGRIFGATDAEAVAINENGQVIINTGGTVVFHDLNHDVVESLNHLPGATVTVAVDINDSIYTNNDNIADGHVIGNSGNLGFFWDGGAMYPVNHLGGGESVVSDLNNKDQVVGSALTAEGATHAFFWTLGTDKKGVIKDLGTLGGTNSSALAINESGQVVGWSETGDFYEEQGVSLPIRHGFLWDKGTMYDLGTHDDFYDFPFKPPYPFSEAVDINAFGDLTGNSITINDHSRGFYLQSVAPIP